MTNTPGVLNKCIQYFIHLDSNHFPIPSTMFAKDTKKLDNGYTGCNEALVPAYQMTAPSGKKQCFNNGLRYFYLLNKLTGNVVPNSMRAMTHKPELMCSGTNSWLEFQIYG